MYRWLPKRFSIRTLLVLVVVVAGALVIVLERYRWTAAHFRYQHVWTLWDVRTLTTPDIVAAADSLFAVERQTLWMPSSTSRRRHAERLSDLADQIEGRTKVWEGLAEALERELDAAKKLRERVAELSAP
jgi:hypothetical protein